MNRSGNNQSDSAVAPGSRDGRAIAIAAKVAVDCRAEGKRNDRSEETDGDEDVLEFRNRVPSNAWLRLLLNA